MRKYELVIILNPKLEEKEQRAFFDLLTKSIEASKGRVANLDIWGKKKLMYPIKKHLEGIYAKLVVDLPAEKFPSWEKKIKIEEKIIRYLLVRIDK